MVPNARGHQGLYYTTLHCTALQYSVLLHYYTTLYFTTLYFTTLYFTTLYNTILCYTTLHCTALPCLPTNCKHLVGAAIRGQGAVGGCGQQCHQHPTSTRPSSTLLQARGTRHTHQVLPVTQDAQNTRDALPMPPKHSYKPPQSTNTTGGERERELQRDLQSKNPHTLRLNKCSSTRSEPHRWPPLREGALYNRRHAHK